MFDINWNEKEYTKEEAMRFMKILPLESALMFEDIFNLEDDYSLEDAYDTFFSLSENLRYEAFPIDDSIDVFHDPNFAIGEFSDEASIYFYAAEQDIEESLIYRYAVWQAIQGEFDSTVDYYNWHPEIECYKVSQHFPGNLAQAIQYIWRSGGPVVKDNVKQDLEKAIDFIQYEIERLDK